MHATTSKYMIQTKMVHEGVCDAEMMILGGPECKFEESRYRWNSHGSRYRVWSQDHIDLEKKIIIMYKF